MIDYSCIQGQGTPPSFGLLNQEVASEADHHPDLVMGWNLILAWQPNIKLLIN